MARPDLPEPTGFDSVEVSVRAELALLPADLGRSGIAAAALVLARGLDGESSLTSKGMAAKTLDDLMARLHALAPPKETHDAIDGITDELARRREHAQRLAGAKAKAGS